MISARTSGLLSGSSLDRSILRRLSAGQVREIWIYNRHAHTHTYIHTRTCVSLLFFHDTRAIFLSGQLEKGLLFEYITLFAVSRMVTYKGIRCTN